MPETLQSLLDQNEITGAQLTPEVLQNILRELQSMPETERETALRELASKAVQDAQDEIALLDESIEDGQSQEFSLEGLKDSIEDPTAKNILDAFSFSLDSGLPDAYGDSYSSLGDAGKESIKLCLWKSFQKNLSVSGIARKATGTITGFGEMIKGFVPGSEDTEKTQTSSALTSSIREDAVISEVIEEVPDLGEFIDSLEMLIGDAAINLEKLFVATSNNSLGEGEKQQIFENPVILSALLENGKYSDDQFNIDLSADPVVLEVGMVDDLAVVQQEFIQELSGDSERMSGTVNRLLGAKERLDGLLGRFGGSTDGLIDTLSNIPVLGPFIKIFFGNSLATFQEFRGLAQIDSIIDGIGNIPVKQSLGNLKSFVPEFTGDEANKDHLLSLETFSFSEVFFKGVSPKLEEYKKAGIAIEAEDFWSKIFTGEGATGVEATIYDALKPKLEDATSDEGDILKVLSDFDVNTINQSGANEEIGGDGAGDTASGQVDPNEADAAETTIEDVVGNPDITNGEALGALVDPIDVRRPDIL